MTNSSLPSPSNEDQFQTDREEIEQLKRELDAFIRADKNWRQRYSLLESQMANCHKEIKNLRNALVSTLSPGKGTFEL